MALCEQAAEGGLGRESQCAEAWASSISSQLPRGWDRELVERFLRDQLDDDVFEAVSSRARDLTFEYWPERVGEPRPEQVLILNADERGQFIAPVKINGRQLVMLVDTGASVILLSWADAVTIGINADGLRFDRQAMTASGASNFAAVTLHHVEFAGQTLTNVEALVAPSTATEVSLLGAPILGRFREVVLSGGNLTIRN
jgi:aspartyl protease family protein